MRITPIFSVLVYYLLLVSQANAEAMNRSHHPFYAGITGGYGFTTWQGLVPPEEKQSSAMAMSTPNNVSEGGVLYGFFAGYEFLPYFALEATYLHYPVAHVSFDEESIFTSDHGITEFRTKTESVSLMGKVMLFIPTTDIRAYSSLGIAAVHRSDIMNDHWMGSPTFGAGFNYNLTEHVMAELGAVYTAGKGVSELNPAEDYFPFLYSVFLRLAYQF